MNHGRPPAWHRRARPLLGTLVEVGVPACGGAGQVQRAIDAAFAAIQLAQDCLSRFDPNSDLSLFHALGRGERVRLRPVTRDVLAAARELQGASGGLFDISIGTAPEGWVVEGAELVKLQDRVRLDLGGIGKGHAVDLAMQALISCGCNKGWINAGGDLRAFGDIETPIHLRHEDRGGVRSFAMLRDGAFATSVFGPGRRAPLIGQSANCSTTVHVSVAAPRCLWADALTKVVAASGDPGHRLLAHYDACAWMH